MQVIAFSGNKNKRTLICSNGTKLERLPILQFDLRFLTLLGWKDVKIIILSEPRYFSNIKLPFDEYIQNLTSCLSTHPVAHPRNGIQKKLQNLMSQLSSFSVTLLSLSGAVGGCRGAPGNSVGWTVTLTLLFLIDRFHVTSPLSKIQN